MMQGAGKPSYQSLKESEKKKDKWQNFPVKRGLERRRGNAGGGEQQTAVVNDGVGLSIQENLIKTNTSNHGLKC